MKKNLNLTIAQKYFEQIAKLTLNITGQLMSESPT